MSNTSDPRSPEQLREHFLVEKELADRLRAAPDREARMALLGSLYEELFARVPHHPRLTRLETAESREASARKRLRFLEPSLRHGHTLLEIAAGDCLMAYAAAGTAGRVIAADISDQRDPQSKDQAPDNFELLIYDGFTLPIADGTVDLAFSYMMLEHLHPDDMEDHFREIARVLKPGGGYLFATPHRFTGPWDISRHFTTEPEGFHLKEWTHTEFFTALRGWGFSRAWTVRRNRPIRNRLINAATCLAEGMLGSLPRNLQRNLGRRVFENVVMLAEK